MVVARRAIAPAAKRSALALATRRCERTRF
jgi:hypothetical protein